MKRFRVNRIRSRGKMALVKGFPGFYLLELTDWPSLWVIPNIAF